MTGLALGLALEALALAGLAAALALAASHRPPNLKIWVMVWGWVAVFGLLAHIGSAWTPATMLRWAAWGALLLGLTWALGQPRRARLALLVIGLIVTLTPLPTTWPLWAGVVYGVWRGVLVVWLAWWLAGALGGTPRPVWGWLVATVALWLWWALALAWLTRPAEVVLAPLGSGWLMVSLGVVGLWALTLWGRASRLAVMLALALAGGAAVLPTLAPQPPSLPRTLALAGPALRAELTLQPARLPTLGVQTSLWDEADQPVTTASVRVVFVPVGGGALVAQRALTPSAAGVWRARPFVLSRTGSWEVLLTAERPHQPPLFATLALRADADWVIRLSEEPVPLTAHAAQWLDDLGPALWLGSALMLTLAALATVRRRWLAALL